jgi:hypothetical protein
LALSALRVAPLHQRPRTSTGNYDGNGVPTLTTDRAASLADGPASKKIATNLKGLVVIRRAGRNAGRCGISTQREAK